MKLLFWLIALVPFALENNSELLHLFSERCSQENRFHQLGVRYQEAVGFLNPWKITPTHVAVVTFSPDSESLYVMRNYCRTRALTARIIDRLIPYGPTAVVMDWWN